MLGKNDISYFFWRQKEKISAASFEKTNTPPPDKLKGALQNASIPKRPFFSFGHATARMRDLFGGEKGTFNIALFFSSAFFFTNKNLPQPMLVQVFLQTEEDILPLSAAITPAKTIRSAYRRCCKRVSLPDQKDNLSGNFVYSPHLPDHGNAAFARLSSVWPEAYKVTSGAFLKMTIQHLQIPVQDGWVVFSQPGLCGRQPGCFIRLISSCVEGLKWM